MEATIPYITREVKQSEFKKIAVGLLYSFAVEIIFFLAACISITVLWYLVFHCVGKSDLQKVYVYDPYEVKYLTIVIGGIKRRVAIKKFYRCKILGQ